MSYDGEVLRVRFERTLCAVGVRRLLPVGLQALLGKQGSNLHSPGSKPGMLPVTPFPNQNGRGDSNPVIHFGRVVLYLVSYDRMSSE